MAISGETKISPLVFSLSIMSKVSKWVSVSAVTSSVLIFKIAAIGIIVAVLNQVLIRSGREEQAMMTTLAGLIVVLIMVVKEIEVLFRTIKSIFGL